MAKPIHLKKRDAMLTALMALRARHDPSGPPSAGAGRPAVERP
ncbi:hypothetical protein [Streptomyces chiangmaiensis]|uniref:Uncharacterized protein n=1 Tax=Streptomyces chiangmaiensis TaxID=766497 RepID=A0ABU7FQW5_9ACTN|nr:hypothetical protein [Streptomyces chiangmaiensis]MED7826505.1 hypothetical protein [Streptomyces chiangmaiensis]